MKLSYRTPLTMIFLVSIALFFMSCEKDSDLFDEYVLAPEEEEVLEPGNTDGNTDGNSDGNQEPDQGSTNGGNQDSNGVIDFSTPDNPENTNKIEGTYTPTSMADITNPANANLKAIISQSFECNDCTFAANQTIEPAGGVISGQNIDLNGAYILNTYKQVFSSSVTFKDVYTASRVSPEVFGAISGDGQDDSAAIITMINNCSLAVGTPNGSYVKNTESTFSRSGHFNWNLNQAKIETISDAYLSHGTSTSNELKFLFFFNGTRPEIYNGEFDGNDIASRLIRVDRTDGFYFESLNIHHYLAPSSAYARSIALKLDVQANSQYGFTQGEVRNCRITDIGAASDGNANNSPYGVSKAIWLSESSDGRIARVYFTGNYIDNIYGDDAEGFYSDKYWGGSYGYQTSNVEYIFDNEDYRGCQRRAMKITISNATITNSYFESATNAPIFSGAQATLIHVFSTSGSNQPLDDVVFTNNEIRIVGNAQNNPLGFTDIKDSQFNDNIITCDTFTAYSYLGFGTGISNPYSGDFENVQIKGNTFNNVFCSFFNVYNPINGGFDFSDNLFDITWSGNPGAYIGVFRIFQSSGDYPEFSAKNIDIRVNAQTATGLNLFGGVFNTWGASPKNWTFDNVDITWEGVSPTYAFAYTGKANTAANFDGSNTIVNCDITGAVGTGAAFVKGTDANVSIINSFGDNNTPITTN